MLTRRRTLHLTAAATAAAVSASVCALPARAQTTGATMQAQAQTLLATLRPELAQAARFDLGSRQWTAWNYMRGSDSAPGARLEQMTAPEKDAALDLLASGLSARGLEKAQHIMLQQDILRDEWGKGAAHRNRERFSVMIFGDPAGQGAWAWRWEGHHLSLTFTLVGDRVVSTTPHSFSSEPNTVPSGPHAGLVVLREEESLGRKLFGDLTGAAKRAALIAERAPGNVQAVRGRVGQIAQQQSGVPLAELSQPQQDLAAELLDVYLPQSFAAPLRGLMPVDFGALRFAWAGDPARGAIYYRLQDARRIIEFATLRNQPEHQHTAVHDLAQNFGAQAL